MSEEQLEPQGVSIKVVLCCDQNGDSLVVNVDPDFINSKARDVAAATVCLGSFINDAKLSRKVNFSVHSCYKSIQVALVYDSYGQKSSLSSTIFDF